MRKPQSKIWRGFGVYKPDGTFYELFGTRDGAISGTGWGYIRTHPTINRCSMHSPEDPDAAKAAGWIVRPVKVIPQ